MWYFFANGDNFRRLFPETLDRTTSVLIKRRYWGIFFCQGNFNVNPPPLTKIQLNLDF